MKNVFYIFSFKAKRRKLQDVVLDIQGVFEMRAEILITSYWFHIELGKNI
jgi:hypothetical protein